MPTDAKCGLLVGVGVVLMVGVLFFQKESPPSVSPPSAVVAQPPADMHPELPAESSPVPARPVSRVDDDPLQTKLP
jgi:hypothetical protein